MKAKSAKKTDLAFLYGIQKATTSIHQTNIFHSSSKHLFIFSKIAYAASEGKTEFPFTSGKNMYDFIDVDELAKMIAKASVQNEIDGIINVCTGQPMTLAERVESYIRDHNYNIKLKYGAFPDRPYDSPGVWGDATRIRRIMARYRDGKA